MSRTILAAVVGLVLLSVPTILVASWVSSAKRRLATAEAAPVDPSQRVAVAAAADEGYCNGDLRRVLRRVLQSCGLLGAAGGTRGCQPVDARNVATMSGDDFNTLLVPLSQRAGIVEFERDGAVLDQQDRDLINRIFAEQRGASYFFVVSRASPEGQVEHNRDLSRARAEAVMAHLQAQFHDPELDRQVGLLWLGEEFAQLDPSFCEWSRSDGTGACDPNTLNRSAFIAWIDCQL